MHPEHRSIGELAYRLWQSRGCPEGTANQDWLDAESNCGLRRAHPKRAHPKRARRTGAAAATATASKALDNSLKDTFPASDPPASALPDEPPANADAKWQAAGRHAHVRRHGRDVRNQRRTNRVPNPPLTDNAGTNRGAGARAPAAGEFLYTRAPNR